MPVIKLPTLGKHLVFCGKTGCGKSKLAERIIAGMVDKYENVKEFSIDTDNSVELKGSTKITSPRQAMLMFNFCNKIRYVPDFKYQSTDHWNDLLQWLCSTSTMKHPHPLIIHINEIVRLGFGADYPRALPIAMATARKTKISLIIETQRPKAIPVQVMTEAQKIYVWQLTRPDDRKYISGFVMGGEEKKFMSDLSKQKLDHSFFEIDTDNATVKYYPPLKLKGYQNKHY